MDAATAAAVAALVVSVLAMTIATAQVLQQYLNTGLLIRMCDSVVYGKMPGRGRRVWQYAQFRFRVIYSVPEVYLRPSLWKASLPHHDNWERGLLPLPDLRHTADPNATQTNYLPENTSGKRTRLAHSAVAGEACWVSLCRVAQHACTDDLFYDLQHCDADRCPSDLPVVPMQVSMRDIVVIALMAGMKCTDASFQGKFVAMDGAAGTITSSSHPMLGSIMHFSPRNAHRPLGIQIRAGSIEPGWMARMWDIVTIAGRRYDARDRKIYELYEGHSWVATSRGRSMVKALPLKQPASRSPVRSFRLRSTSPTRILRRRATAHSPNRAQSVSGTSALTTSYHIRNGNVMNQSQSTTNSRDSPNRERSPEQVVRGQLSTQHDTLHPNLSPGNANADNHSRTRQRKSILPWKRHLRTLLSRRLIDSRMGNTQQSPSEHATDIEGYGGVVHPATARISTHDESVNGDFQGVNAAPFRASTNVNGNWFPPASGQRRMLDGGILQQYIKEKQQAEQTIPQGRNLFLTWRPLSAEEASPTEDVQQDWQASLVHSRRERSSSLVDKWREVLNSRQQMRQERDTETEWEIESYYSASRQSSIAASDRRRRVSPSDVRSFSRESHNSRRSIQSSTKNSKRKHGRTVDGEVLSQQQDHRESPPPKVSSLHPVSRDNHINYSYGREPIEIGQIHGRNASAAYSVEPVDDPPHKPDPETTAQSKVEPSRRKRVHYTERDEAPAPADDSGRQEGEQDIDMSPQLDALGPVPTNHKPVGGPLPQSDPVITVEPLQEMPEKSEEPSTRGPSTIIAEAPRSILRPPRERFPEDPKPVREGVAPRVKAGLSEGIPAHARWTKIRRGLVNPEALRQAGERFEETDHHVVVLRVLSRQEIVDLARRTQEIREGREREWIESLQTQEVKSTKASTSNRPDDEPAKSIPDQILSANPSTEDASSSINWSSQSVYGSGGEPRISHSPDGISETEEVHRGRSTSFQPKKSSIASGVALRTDDSPGGQNRSMSPRQALAAQWEERLKTNGLPPRRRASTRSQSSSSRESSSASDSSDKFSIGVTGDVSFKSHPFRRHGISQLDGSDVQQPSMIKARVGDGAIKWLWICQIDVLPGYFANPWHDYFSRETCLGTIVTMLEALEYYTDHSTLAYVDALPWCEHWLRRGQATHPSYAINAMGGVIIPGGYDLVKFESYSSPMPVIQLLGSYHRQIDPSSYQGSDALVVENLAELMALDSWLSFCGRQPEIYDGRNNLEFSSLDRTAAEGGHQIVKELAGLIAHTLEKALLTEEEQLFTMMAMLRAAKMALCLLNGPTTAKLRDIFLRDVQVYLV
ncbi:hypothetical protein LTR84_009155 [Exophiala bonariae]|uniref:DUF8035 domain-containing protein n=1 Tax=Exophiala bonariae TaxID=1690606 RepID=A0AAV9MXU1_9EURO|nr:hypothetical protein LTR84_009155 [Exophiala bonariae]